MSTSGVYLKLRSAITELHNLLAKQGDTMLRGKFWLLQKVCQNNL